jgi:hypothetical protein
VGVLPNYQTMMARRIYSVMPILHLSNILMTRAILTHKVRLVSNPAVIHRVNGTEGLVKKKFRQLLQWYEEVTGMDEVRIAQNRVLEAEEKFISAQERRREASTLVSAIQSKLKDLYAELDSTTRGEERYVHLVTQEHSVLKEEKAAVQEFQRYEREEREYFAALSSAVKESHEKERAQAERTKYWSIIGSIIGTVIGIVGSSVNSEMKMKELRKLIRESLQKYEGQYVLANVPETLSRHEKELSMIVNEMKNVTPGPSDHVLGHLNELIHTLDNKVNSETTTTSEMFDELSKSIKKQEACFEKNFKEMKSMITSQNIQIGDDKVVVLPYGADERLQQQLQKFQFIVTCCTIASIIVPLLCKYF